jgi:hypothetical protein
MNKFKFLRLMPAIFILVFFLGCKNQDNMEHGNNPFNWCYPTEIFARSVKSDCNIQFWDILFKYTYVKIESSFYSIGAPCNENIFEIKYINSLHDHCENDYTFKLNLSTLTKEEFFKKGSFPVSKFSIWEESLCGGHGSNYTDVDITLVWDEVSVVGKIYSGKGKFIINKDIPFGVDTLNYPAQEIPFIFQGRDRMIH